ncbi:MAG: A/G-specific adenine glycosylase [Bacillota bacterium]
MNLPGLLQWFKHHQRDLPFRIKPSPYGIWISEVMLQQTQMDTVLKYYASFLKRFPNIQSLARASLEEVLTEVQGLGYYRRFRLMHEGAKYIAKQHQGIFPSTFETVMAIPGVGLYTAGAIMAIAYNQPYSATDGNVIRVLSRYYGVKKDMRLPASKRHINDLHQKLVLQTNPRNYIQAVMELGALVCRPVKPSCEKCPLQKECYAFQNGKPEALPIITKTTKVKVREWKTFMILQGEKILMRKNKTNLLKDFYLLPQWETKLEEVEQWLIDNHFKPIHLSNPQAFQHQFTHQTWIMEVYQLKVKSGQDSEGEWIPIQSLNTIPIPEAHQKIIRKYFPLFLKSKAL